ncbi:MAG TPA: hypothetical protein VHC91_10605 [Trinickia sp.]|uniref:hypothetical protein n=1 Tax=Trinickia sp. TaxID=2571163 RepID=UPI002B6DF226|nr:hypothetical protein [Trinickia sp.]HVW50828.1 hypothetical protein [Trinickia sp.]
MNHPIEYLAGERAAHEALTRISADGAHPNELEATFSRLTSEPARAWFFRVIQKRLEREGV